MSEVKHKASTIFILFLLDVILSVALIPAIEAATNVGYTDSVIGAFVIFIVILVVGSASIGSYDLDKKYHLHERAIKRTQAGIQKAQSHVRNRRGKKRGR
jgi:membrane protein required for beta-lactamase induction